MDTLKINEFTAVVDGFIKHNDLVDEVAKSGTTLDKVVNAVATSLEEQGYQFTDNCKNFIKTLKREHNRVMTKLGHNPNMRRLV